MAKNKGYNNNRVRVSDFIITPKQRMEAKLDAAGMALGIASTASQDEKHKESFYETWEKAYDKLNGK